MTHLNNRSIIASPLDQFEIKDLFSLDAQFGFKRHFSQSSHLFADRNCRNKTVNEIDPVEMEKVSNMTEDQFWHYAELPQRVANFIRDHRRRFRTNRGLAQRAEIDQIMHAEALNGTARGFNRDGILLDIVEVYHWHNRNRTYNRHDPNILTARNPTHLLQRLLANIQTERDELLARHLPNNDPHNRRPGPGSGPGGSGSGPGGPGPAGSGSGITVNSVLDNYETRSLLATLPFEDFMLYPLFAGFFFVLSAIFYIFGITILLFLPVLVLIYFTFLTKEKLVMRFKSFYHKLVKLVVENWWYVLVGFLLYILIKAPFRFFFWDLDFLLGFNVLSGLYAILIIIVKDNLQNKGPVHNKYRYLTIFVTAMLFSYIVVNYNFFQLIFG